LALWYIGDIPLVYINAILDYSSEEEEEEEEED